MSSQTPAEIHVALAYYHLHRQEIDGYLEEERAIGRGLVHDGGKAAWKNMH